MNYNTIVEKLKIIARDGLRMNMVSRVQTQISDIEKNINEHTENVMNLKKDIARENFAETQLVEADPDFAEKKEYIKKGVEMIEKLIVSENEKIQKLNELKDEKVKKIESIQNGEIKVSIDELNEKTNELINEITKSTAVKAVESVTNN